VSAFGLLIAYGPAAGAATAPVVRQAGATQQARSQDSARQLATARAGLKHLLASWHDTAELVGGRGALGPAGTIKAQNTPTAILSSNWSGYGDVGTDFTGVGATWIEPTVTCPSQVSTLAAFWVGIDGLDNASVEQDGTFVECDNGTPSYFMWWEMYPTNDIQIDGTVNPGDSITASVTRAGSSYFLDVTDNTSDQGFGTSQTCEANTTEETCLDSSAEWIAEAPAESSGIQPLADFQSWGLTSATVDSSVAAAGVISSFADYAITMIDSDGVLEAEPSALDSDGNAFDVAFRPTQRPLVPREQEVGGHPSGAPYPSRMPPAR
jgi:hypothetical protein